jgi:hypothetical protein
LGGDIAGGSEQESAVSIQNQTVVRDFVGDPGFMALVSSMLAPGEQLVNITGFSESRTAVTTKRILKGSASSTSVLAIPNGAIDAIEWFNGKNSIMLTVKFGGLEVTILVNTVEEGYAIQQATALY